MDDEESWHEVEVKKTEQFLDEANEIEMKKTTK